MKPIYHVLQVTSSDDQTVAVLPLPKVVDREVNEQVHADFVLLAASVNPPLVVDLRPVAFCAGSFLSRLVELHKALTARACPYTLLVSAALRETLAVTRLDELFPVVDGPGILSCERIKRAKKAAQLKYPSSAATRGSFLQRWFAWLR